MNKHITILDGGMGQELIRRSGAKPTPMWSAQVLMDKPEIVQALHVDYIKAGAQIITLNSYSVTPERLRRDGDESDFERLQQRAIELAQAARDEAGVAGVRIAGCLPPLVGSYHPEQAPDDKTMANTYKQLVEIQKDHVDLFICETMSSVREASSAATAAKDSGLPVWVAMSVEDDESGNLRSAEPIEQCVAALDTIEVDAKLINCSQPESIDAAWPGLCSGSGPVGAYANAFTSIAELAPGGTVDSLGARHDLDPEAYSKFAVKWVEQAATIVGGCCEVGPDHIRAIAQALK